MSSHSHRAFRGKRFPFYSALLYVGLVTALVVADRLARWSGIDPIRLVASFLVSIPICLAGARALEVVLNWSYYRARPREILRLSNGGAAMYGALPPVVLLSIPLARWLGIPFGMYWDFALVSILAGMIPTRFGCLGAGCCAGRPTASRFGFVMRNARGVRARRYPSPLFEAGLGAALLTASLLLWERSPFPGAVALGICAGYGAGRFALDELREERSTRLAGLGAYQWMSVALFVLGVGGLALGWAGSPATRTLGVSVATDAPGMLHLAVSGLLLLPVVHLFRFLGCDLIFKLRDPCPGGIPFQMIVIVPDMGTGPATVRMQFLLEPDMTEACISPVDLALISTEPDGRLRFEGQRDLPDGPMLYELPEGDYTVNCTVSRSDAGTRFGTCSGTLEDKPGLIVAFDAPLGSVPPVLNMRLCFMTL
jgi:phosphatidylglycerol:prolipoprotein diacylglycerol transferase